MSEHTSTKADMVARGLCRQCGKKRGTSTSTSRCARCLKKNREQERKANGSRPYRRGGPGRPPLHPDLGNRPKTSPEALGAWDSGLGVGKVPPRG